MMAQAAMQKRPPWEPVDRVPNFSQPLYNMVSCSLQIDELSVINESLAGAQHDANAAYNKHAC